MIVRARYLLLALLALAWQSAPVAAADDDSSCAHHVAQWLDPDTGAGISSNTLFSGLAKSRIVLLGESHTSAPHHRWQHYMLAALHARNPNMAVGFEMLPRSVQPVLDEWSAGALDEEQFLERSDWNRVWGYDPGFYLPLLHFARLNRLPTIALNVDRKLISRVGEGGWDAVPDSQREGISDPAPASDAYRRSLAELYGYKQTLDTDVHGGHSKSPDLDKIMASEDFANFVEAQLTWDRAMAEALAAAHRRDPSALIVGIVGRGHLEYGYGIPHQLADMGIDEVDVLLPLDADQSCDPLPIDLASAVFVVDVETEEQAPRPRLGVMIESGDEGVLVSQVVDDSVAEASGIRDGDVILTAAGFDTRTAGELIEVIQRQAPGTWLPLTLRRGDEELELIARFPQAFD